MPFCDFDPKRCGASPVEPGALAGSARGLVGRNHMLWSACLRRAARRALRSFARNVGVGIADAEEHDVHLTTILVDSRLQVDLVAVAVRNEALSTADQFHFAQKAQNPSNMPLQTTRTLRGIHRAPVRADPRLILRRVLAKVKHVIPD